MTNRGNSVFSRVLRCPNNEPPRTPPKVNDFFLHALFARVTLSDNRTIEFETKYDQANNEIELIIPAKDDGNKCCIPPREGEQDVMRVFDQLIGMKRGPNFQCFINWLIGSRDIVKAAVDAQDPAFIPSTSLQTWIGGKTANLNGEKLVIVLPEDEPTTVGHNLKTFPDFNGKAKLYLIWAFIYGGSSSSSSYWIRSSANVMQPDGSVSVMTTGDVEISTYNLIEGDVRETLLLEVDQVGSDNIVNFLINRHWNGSPDARSETVGIVGLRAVFEEA